MNVNRLVGCFSFTAVMAAVAAKAAPDTRADHSYRIGPVKLSKYSGTAMKSLKT